MNEELPNEEIERPKRGATLMVRAFIILTAFVLASAAFPVIQ
jgi:hypothetical protein